MEKNDPYFVITAWCRILYSRRWDWWAICSLVRMSC